MTFSRFQRHGLIHLLVIWIPGYVVFRQDRDKQGGGLVVYVKDAYKASVVKESSLVTENHFQQLWIKVQCKKLKSFLLCTAYRPPDTPISLLDGLGSVLMDCLLPGLEVILLGDLNCNLMDSCASGRALLDFCAEFNLTQLVKGPTRVTETSQTLIDIALTTNTNIVDTCEVKPAALSDHSLIRLILKLNSPRPRCTFITTRSYKDYDGRKFVADLANVPFHMITCFNDLDDQVEAFNNLFLNVLDEHAPVKKIKIKSRPNPFITPEIRQLMKTRDKWHKSAIRTKNKMHWNAYRFFRQEVKREIRLAEKEYVCNEIHNSNGNTNSLWKVINRCLPRQQTPFVTIGDPKTQACRFNEYYSSVGVNVSLAAEEIAEKLGFTDSINNNHDTNTNSHEINHDAFTFHSITQDDVNRIVNSLPSNKAPGYDKVTAKILKDSLPVTAPAITNLINYSFSSCEFAQVWKQAVVVPYKKSAESEQPSDTRPISLLPVMSKVIERSAHAQLTEYLISKKVISPYQSGNRKSTLLKQHFYILLIKF